MGQCDEYILTGELEPDQGFRHSQEFRQWTFGGVNSAYYMGDFVYNFPVVPSTLLIMLTERRPLVVSTGRTTREPFHTAFGS